MRAVGPGELRVEVAAVGLNRADIIQRKGRYPAPPGVVPDVPGLEYAGTVAEVGSEVRTFRVGDRVMGIVGGGAFARQLLVNEREAIAVPPALTLEQAAAIPEAYLTAFDAMLLQGELRVGETVLLHAVGSGVGTAALQLALATGARPLGVSRSAAKLERCAALGLPAADALLADEATLVEAVLQRTQGTGAALVIDTLGGPWVARSLDCLAQRGRLVVVGLLAGAQASLPLGTLLSRRAHVIGTVLRSRPAEEKAALAQTFSARVLPLLQSGRLQPVVDDVLPMDRLTEAHQRMERDETFGKLVLRW